MNTLDIKQQKPVAPACERNREPILDVLQTAFRDAKHIIEIGSGTGEHGVYFAERLPWLEWQCSDVTENLSGIEMWVQESNLSNLLDPIELDVTHTSINKSYDAVFTANTLHIISADQVEDFFRLIGKVTNNGAELVIYGPFNYNGAFSSDSNAQFELWLKERNPLSGIRHFEWINQLAMNVGFKLINDHEMPANNRCLNWKKN
jgi:cyclopropane fatty-acyl-phospholipid synthase-like methyltransferase